MDRTVLEKHYRNHQRRSCDGYFMNDRNTMAKRMGKMLFVKRGKGRSDSSNASMSVVDDNHTHYSGDGEKSVALTVNSQTTIKASNRKLSPGPQSRDSKQNSTERKGWKGLKRLVGGTSPPKGSHRRIHSKSEDYFRENKKHSMSDDLTQRNRVWSEDGARRRMVLASDKREASSFSSRAANKLDIAIRGRLDGIDILSLGGVRKSTLWSRNDAQISLSPSKFERTASSLSFDPFQITFVATKTSYGAADLVKDMILFSGGKDDCEVILEGFFPGGSDRWTVKVNSSSERSGEFLEEVISDYGDSALLWDIMWGDSEPPPTPTHMKFSDSEDEDILTLASACSVPVDLDEDSFIIDTPEHFRSVQDVATVPLQSKRFDATLKIFEKLVSGLHERNDETLRHLEGCTRHNMGMVMMCQSNFKQAREMFTEAVKIRTACLPQNHPDVAVSLVREGHTYFALEEYDQARKSFSLALAMVPLEDATRAKILNGIGAVYYQQERFSEALKEFTSALEIQRQWLDGAVRRESIVYDASITLGNMGKVFLELKEYDVAFSVFEEACLLQMSVFRKDHFLSLQSLESLALILIKMESHSKAVPLLRGLLRSKQAVLGLDHTECIEVTGILAFVLVKIGELNEASALLRRVSEWQEKHIDPSEPCIEVTKKAISALRKSLVEL